MIDLKSSDLVTQIEALKNKEISSYELTSMYLKNIQDNENLIPTILTTSRKRITKAISNPVN